MKTVDTPATRAASGVTRRNARTGGCCPRCHCFGAIAPESIVCDRCASARDSILTVTVTVTVPVVGGDR
jgi:hypothetical protein